MVPGCSDGQPDTGTSQHSAEAAIRPLETLAICSLQHCPTGTLAIMRTEEPTWGGPYFGQFGVLADDGDRVQCHVCGDMFDLLGAHANHKHGLAGTECPLLKQHVAQRRRGGP